MPRIPIYNVTARIQGQAGSTSVPQISQGATSGAIASQTDSLVTGLQNVSKVASNIVKIESERIVAKENIKYKTMLDNTDKLIQANLANEPERWMDAYENGFTIGETYIPGRLAIMSEIRNNKYKYDFINQSVANAAEVNNLTIREGLFENYLKETKKQQLIVFEDQSKILAGDIGESINMDTTEFDVKMLGLSEAVTGYRNGGGKDPVAFEQEVLGMALSDALQTEYGNRPPEDNINLLPSEVTNPNILTIMNYMDDTEIRKIFEDFSDAADKQFDDFNSVRNHKIDEGKDKVAEMMIMYDNPKTSIAQKNEIAKFLAGTEDVFFEPGEKLGFAQYHQLQVENEYDISFNRTGNPSLTAVLTRQYLDRKITFAEVRKRFSELSLDEQATLSNLKTGRKQEQYIFAEKVIKGLFGFSTLNEFNIFSEDSLAEQYIQKSTNIALQRFNNLILEKGKDLDFQTEIKKIGDQVYLESKDALFSLIAKNIREFDFFESSLYVSVPFNEINPSNVLKVIADTKQNIQNATNLNPGAKQNLKYKVGQFIFDNKDLLDMMESYNNE